jgi:hypothetical protein
MFAEQASVDQKECILVLVLDIADFIGACFEFLFVVFARLEVALVTCG